MGTRLVFQFLCHLLLLWFHGISKTKFSRRDDTGTFDYFLTNENTSSIFDIKCHLSYFTKGRDADVIF
jgi:hypothetical protein